MSLFTGRDLALLLPDQVGDTVSLRFTETGEVTDTYEPLKPKIDNSKKVTRYFPGKAPVWVDKDENENLDSSQGYQATASNQEDRRLSRLKTAPKGEDSAQRRRVHRAEIIIESYDDDRKGSDDDEKKEETHIPIILPQETISRTVEEEEEIIARRARVLQRLAEKKDDESNIELGKLSMSNVLPEDEEEESEYVTDSDSDDVTERILQKPVFVPKAKRATILEAEEKAKEEELKIKKKQEELEERKKQTRALVAESIRREEERKEGETATDQDSDAGLPDDFDDEDDEAEYEAWKLREMSRLKRDAEERERDALEAAELSRRRNMTEAERMEEDRKLGRFDVKEKAKWKFLQKYYHKGVFYMDEDSVARDNDVRKKEYDAPTLEDKFDREKLPEILQVKNFGRRGRTKYTHLVDQDTTRFDNPLPPNNTIKEKYLSKRGGVGDIDTAGRFVKKAKLA